MPAKIAFILFALWFGSPVQSSPVQSIALNQITDQFLGKHVWVLKDSEQNLAFFEVYRHHAKLPWKSSQNDVPSLGFTSMPHWFYLAIHNDSPLAQQRLLEINFPTLDDIQVCYLARKLDLASVICLTEGDRYDFSKRPIIAPQPVFPIQFAPSSTTGIYIRVKTSTALELPLRLWTDKAFNGHLQTQTLVLGLLFGIALGVCAYSLFLYYCTRETLYLYYIAALISSMLMCSVLFGLPYQYLWPEHSEWNERFTKIFAGIMPALITLFTKRYLILFFELNARSPKLTKLLDIQILSSGILAILGMFLIYSSEFTLWCRINFLWIEVSILYIGIYLVFKGANYAWFFLCSAACVAVPGIIATLHRLAVIPYLPTDHIVLASITAMFILLSLSITKHINKDREEKLHFQQKSIIHLKRYQDLYDTAMEGLFCVHPNGQLVYGNPVLEKTLNISLKTLSSHPVFLHNYFEPTQNIWKNLTAALYDQGSLINHEVQGKRKGDNSSWYMISARFTQTHEGEFIEGSLIDISQRKHQELQLAYLAHHDPLTHLYNRTAFENYLQDAVRSQSPHTLLFIDLDQFKVINDTCGHAAGDECLRQIAAILQEHTDPQDMLARLGGDEFGIVFWDQNQLDGKASAKRLLQALAANHFQWLQRVFKTSASIGLITIDEHISCGEQALSLADAACYEAKEAGRNRVVANHPDKQATIYRHSQMDMVATLTEALRNHQLVLFQQPIIALFTEPTSLQHYEVLMRLHTDNGLLSPGFFLPAAQRYQMLPQIDRWCSTEPVSGWQKVITWYTQAW
ncbi:putative Diguanylate cyclase [Crenothrix polyspora]|nr:diguanylate cyclase [Crenothrix polyspora]SJM92658.1 putative Diguanylate cyclase [Crenothrix polyspora]